jgi:hypothetical protein
MSLDPMTGAPETKRIRPKAPRVTHFIQLQPFGVFVVNAEQYIATGGDPYSPLWLPVIAHTDDAARAIGENLILRFAGKQSHVNKL